MSKEQPTLFQQLNAPFPYHEYHYDSFGDRCYISGQAVAERLNEVLGVGFWTYQGLYDTEKIVQDPNGKNPRIKIYVEFSFFNSKLKEWIRFIDVGSEQIKAGMNEGDATKSAITDGMKKCASRLGVASDLYKGLIRWDKQQQTVIVPEHYRSHYEQAGLLQPTGSPTKAESAPKQNRKKTELTQQLKKKESATQKQMKAAWQQLAGNLDGFDEWCLKKYQEGITEQQMLSILSKRLQERNSPASA